MAICKSEGVERFEDLELGPLVRYPLVVHYFGVNSDVTEVYRITTEDIIAYLFEFLDLPSTRAVNVDEFLEFVSEKQSVVGKEKLCVRVQSIGLYITQIRIAKHSEHPIVRRGLARTREAALRRSKRQELLAEKQNQQNEHVAEENEPCKRKRRYENVASAATSAPWKLPKIDLQDQGSESAMIDLHLLSSEALQMFVNTWKEVCQVNKADEVLSRMLLFYKTKNRKRFEELFKSYPFVGLLNAAVSFINSGICEYSSQIIVQQDVDAEKLVKSADNLVDVDFDPVEKDYQGKGLESASKGVHLLSSEALKMFLSTWKEECQGSKVGEVFSRMLLFYKTKKRKKVKELFTSYPFVGLLNAAVSFINSQTREHSSQTIVQQDMDAEKLVKSADNLVHVGVDPVEKDVGNSSPKTLRHIGVSTEVAAEETVSLEAHMLPLQFDALLSQSLSSLPGNKSATLQHIHQLLARQFPTVCFESLKSEPTINIQDFIQERLCKSTSSCVLFSAPLLKFDLPKEEASDFDNYVGPAEGIMGAVTTKDAIGDLLKAPMLADLNLWSHWDLLFAPSLGCMLEWLLKEANTKDLMCLVTKDGKIIRLDHSATPDSFLKVFIQGSAFETSVKLLSLYALYGGEQNVPLSLLKCQAEQAFKVIIDNNNILERDLHENNKNTLEKVLLLTSRFIHDCLSYLPIEFCSFVADVLIGGLQSLVKGVHLAMLTECKKTEERHILHEVGLSLGLVDWVNDYYLFSSSSCLDVESSKLNVPVVAEDLGCHVDVDYKQVTIDKILTQVSSDDVSSNTEQLSLLAENDPACVIQSIRQDEFGLDRILSVTENRMLEKQHARLGRALHCLSQELYSQDSHFLLELVQNADDNVYLGNDEPTLAFILQQEGIVVLNNEKGFSPNNIRALCDVGNSTKQGLNNAGYIGKKGIGFKSVFRITDAPEVHSNGFHIKFDISQGQIGFVIPTIVTPCDMDLYSGLVSSDDEGPNKKSWNTCIMLPFKSNLAEPFPMNNIVSMFSDLNPSLLLFLHRLKCIRFRNSLDDSLIVMKKKVTGNGLVQVVFGHEKMTWFVASRQLAADKIRSDVQRTEISIAFTFQEAVNGSFDPVLKQQPVFAFLPLRTYGFKFILQADFVLPSSREEVDGISSWNQWLLSEFPDLFVHAERLLCDLPCYKGNQGRGITAFMSFIPLVGEVHGFFSSLPRIIISKLRISNCLILEGNENEWVPPCKVLRNWTDQARSLIPDSLLNAHLSLGFLNKNIVLSDALATALGVEEYGPKILLKLISSLCYSGNGLKSMGLSWLSSSLSAIYTMLSHSSSKPFSICESDFVFNLQKIPFIPLSNGNYCSVDKDSIWLHSDDHVLNGFPKLYSKLRTVNPDLLSAAASPESSDATIEHVTKMLYKVGVQQLSAHEIMKVHILPAISDGKNAIHHENLMIEYLAFAMLHLQSSCSHCFLEKNSIISELREKALILTNYGYKRCNDVPIHFGREYMNPVDVNKLINGLDIKWHEIDATYLKHPITKFLSDGVSKWRMFFQDLGVTDFVQVVQVEKRLADMSHLNFKNMNVVYFDSVAKNWESEELINLLSHLSSKNDKKISILMMEVLDKLWDVYFSDKVFGYYMSANGDSKAFKSSVNSILQDLPWIYSSIGTNLYKPTDLFHDCVAVNSVLGCNAPYTIPKVKCEKLVADIGLKAKVTLHDALSVLRLWRRSEAPLKASISQMSTFYGFLWKNMSLFKKEIIEELQSGPFIFIPYNASASSHNDVVPGEFLSPHDVYWSDGSVQTTSVHSECISSTITFLHSLFPNLHDFFVNDCGVNETPPLRKYLQSLLQLSVTALPHQAAKKVLDIFLMWDEALKSGSMNLEDVEYLKNSLLEKEYKVLPTKQDKWVSMHPSFGIICWCDDDNLRKEFDRFENILFLYFGESTDEESHKFRAKPSAIIQRLGIPALSEIVVREAIYYGPEDNNFIFSLVNWILPYAQRYIFSTNSDTYLQLKKSSFESLIRHLKIVVVEKLFYQNVIKRWGIASQKRHDCNCLLQDNVLYCIKGSDPHSIFLELSCLLYNGVRQLDLANFLHMITAMAQSGASEDQMEFFISNSQKVEKLSPEESHWSLQPISSVEIYLTGKNEEQNNIFHKRSCIINTNWPPADWKTAPGFDSTRQTKPSPVKLELQNIALSEKLNTEVSEISGNFDVSGMNMVNFGDDGEEQVKITGRMGEIVAYKYFRGKRGASSVKWVNEAKETGLPYDIVIGSDDDRNRQEYIEVKATKNTSKNWFLLTIREWEFARQKGEGFSIARVSLADDGTSEVKIYKNPARLCKFGNMKLAIVVPKQ